MSALGELSQRQRLFVEGVAKGMAAGRAYEAAGYTAKGDSADQAASRLSRNVKVRAALEEIQKSAEDIADAAEIQRFWTRTVRGLESDADFRDRLKASELLGKAGAVFTERRQVDTTTRVEFVSPDPIDE